MSELVLLAPMQGWAVPLEETPDPVFADRMLGDGVAIDPFGQVLHAPCDGEVISLHRALHAVTVRSTEGAEILMHIGLETVALGGRGFIVHVRPGQSVRAGEPLISFDLDVLARNAKSLVSPIVIVNSERFAIADRALGRVVAVGEPLMKLRGLKAELAADDRSADSNSTAERSTQVALAHGIHARPAAAIAAVAKGFSAETYLSRGDRRGNARSPVALIALGVRHGEVVRIEASGPDAEAAASALEQLILHGMKEPVAIAPIQASLEAPKAGPKKLSGVIASPGLAIGVAVHLTAPEIMINEAAGPAHEERHRLEAALDQVRAETTRMTATGPSDHRAILGAHLAFLDDPELLADAQARIAAGVSAASAWKTAVDCCIAVVRETGNDHLIERVDDLVDLQRRVLLALGGQASGEGTSLPRGAILLAEDLLPTQLLSLDRSRLAGLCTARGGPTSHVAIIAASLNLPALVAAGPDVLAVTDGTRVILDANRGLLDTDPDAEAIAAAELQITAAAESRRRARTRASELCITVDGHRIEVMANLGSAADARAAVAAGAEGCGLLRTEFMFLDRTAPPDEDEQTACYQAVADILGDRPLTLRTLDVGGDKAVPYLKIAPEENPALGLRGIRVGLAQPDLLRTQLRAMLQVRAAQPLRIMLPMIASLEEFRTVRAIAEAICADLPSAADARFGVMVETPAAAITADLICAEAEFISLGTNDLAQYVLAMDRGNPAVAASVDGLHPGVLRMAAAALEGAKSHGRPAGVCGGLASDLSAAPILIGLGVTSLSAAPDLVPELKALIRSVCLEDCRILARHALALPSAPAVRTLAEAWSAHATLLEGEA